MVIAAKDGARAKVGWVGEVGRDAGGAPATTSWDCFRGTEDVRDLDGPAGRSMVFAMGLREALGGVLSDISCRALERASACEEPSGIP